MSSVTTQTKGKQYLCLQLPVWVLRGIPRGLKLELLTDWDVDGRLVFSAGDICKLEGVTRHVLDGQRALVLFGDDASDLVDLPFELLRPLHEMGH